MLTGSEIVIAACGAGVFGCFAGSFLNVVAHRLPRNLSIAHPPSRCGACGTQLAWHDNLPLIGWLALRGRCRHCGGAIAPRYVLMELLCGALTAATVAFALLVPQAPAPWIADPLIATALAATALLIAVYACVVAMITDLEHQIIPDEISLPLIVAAPALSVAAGTGLPESSVWLSWLDPHQPARSLAWIAAGAGAVGVALILLLMALSVRVHAGFETWQPAERRAYRIGSLFAAGSVAAGFALAALLPAEHLLVSALLLYGMLGFAVGWLLILLVTVVGSAVARTSAMGFGDAKLFAPLCALLGPEGALIAFALACGVGVLLSLPKLLLGGDSRIPFGPSLIIGWALTIVFGPWLHARLPWQP